MRRPPAPTPLIDLAAGRDQDDRAALRAAWRRIQSARVAGSTDLHVRELLFHVFARDRSGLGVQLSYTELARELETSPRTARDVVARASAEFGLLIVREQRYVSGGQAANRYAIAWDTVRAINTPGRTPAASTTGHPGQPTGVTPSPTLSAATPAPPDVPRQPPDVPRHPPDVTRRPPDLPRHPIEETPRSLPSHQPRISPPPPAASSATIDPTAASWPVVVSALTSLGMSRDGAAAATRTATDRGLTQADALDLVGRWQRLRAVNPAATVGWLHRWLTGQSKPPAADEAATRSKPSTNSTAEAIKLRRETLRARIVRSGRSTGTPEAIIDRRVAEALAAFDRDHTQPPTPNHPQP